MTDLKEVTKENMIILVASVGYMKKTQNTYDNAKDSKDRSSTNGTNSKKQHKLGLIEIKRFVELS